ncbi:exosome complex component Csl4p [[Candida] railenensis]|uniref:Exosome complex component Csl4p n=1 Tax=[Candida] railenensis TaxID=45579 RepID=A0A9P0W017_9ASCO|nr:exosome complex component Csl4p [[Candida] railenensis]
MSVAIPGQYISSIYKYTEDENSGSQVEKYVSGRGTTVANIKVPENNKFSSIPVIVATILGKIVIRELKSSTNSTTGGGVDNIKTFIVSVVPKSNSYLESAEDIEGTNISINLPQENDIVLVRITKINPRQAFAEILSVESHGNVIKDSGIGSNGELAHQSIAAGGGSQNLSSHTTIASSQSTAINAQAIDLGETFKGIIRSQDVRSTERDKVKIIECFKPGDIVRAVVISLGDGSNYYLSTAKDDLGVVFAKSEGGSGGLMYALDWQHMICESSGIIEKRKCAKPFV